MTVINNAKEFMTNITEYYGDKYSEVEFDIIITSVKQYHYSILEGLFNRVIRAVPRRYGKLPDISIIEKLAAESESNEDLERKSQVNMEYEYELGKKKSEADAETKRHYDSLPAEVRKKIDDEVEAIPARRDRHGNIKKEALPKWNSLNKI